MNPKLLIVKIITLLFMENRIETMTDSSVDFVKDLLTSVKVPELQVGLDHERQIMLNLKRTAYWMCEQTAVEPFVLADLQQRLTVDCVDDRFSFDAIYTSIALDRTQEEYKRSAISIRHELELFLKEEKIAEILNEANKKIKFERDSIPDMRAFVSEIAARLEPYQTFGREQEDPAVVDSIDLRDTDKLTEMYGSVKNKATNTALLKCGYQAINRMAHGGFRRGQTVVIGALQHNFKTGFSLNLFKQFLLYNDPFPLLNDKTKKPLFIRISFEDDLDLNLQFLYTNLYENETGEKADLAVVTPAQIAEYVSTRLQSRGWEVAMLRVDPTGWTYRDIMNLVLKYEAEGYEVVGLMVDYLNMIPKTGCTQGPTGADIRDLYRRMRNFTSARDILFITPHQLSTEAKMLIRNGNQDFVKDIANKGYYDGCKTIDQEVDMEIYIHIEKINGASYLTCQRGKHRIVEKTDDKDLYTVLPFQDIGTIRDDINIQDSSRRRPGGGPVGSGEEIPFWENQMAELTAF